MENNLQVDKQTVVNSLTWKFLERFLVQFINFAIQIVLARILAKSDFGSVAIMNAIITYLTLFVQAGFATAIVQKKEISKIDISTIFTISLLVASILYIALFFCAPFIGGYYEIPELEPAIRVSSITLFLNAIYSIQNAILEREMRFKEIFIRSLIAILVSGGVGIGLAYGGFGIWSLVAQSVVHSGLLVTIMCFDKQLLIVPKFSGSSFKKTYSFTWKILVTNLITSFQDFFRTLIIGKVYTTDELADYDRAYTYSGYITTAMSQATSSVMLPAFSRNQDDESSIKKMARRTTSLTAFILFPTLLGVAAVAKPLVLVLLTSKWSGCVPFLMLFCLLRIPSCISVVDKQVYYALGKSQIGLYYEIGLNILKIIGLVVTLKISTMAIAISATAIEYVGIVAIFLISKTVFKYSILEHLRDLFKPFLSATIMAAAVYCISFINLRNWLTLLIQIFVGVLLYFSLEILLKDENLPYLKALLKEKLRKRKTPDNPK
jgi:teichuronic acid exporter